VLVCPPYGCLMPLLCFYFVLWCCCMLPFNMLCCLCLCDVIVVAQRLVLGLVVWVVDSIVYWVVVLGWVISFICVDVVVDACHG